MLRRRPSKVIAACSVLTFAAWSLGSPPPAAAQWHSRAAELPGMESGTTILLIAAGTAAAVLVVALAMHADHSNPKSPAKPDSLASSGGHTSLLGAPASNSFAIAPSPSLGPPGALSPRLPLDFRFAPESRQILVRLSTGF